MNKQNSSYLNELACLNHMYSQFEKHVALLSKTRSYETNFYSSWQTNKNFSLASKWLSKKKLPCHGNDIIWSCNRSPAMARILFDPVIDPLPWQWFSCNRCPAMAMIVCNQVINTLLWQWQSIWSCNRSLAMAKIVGNPGNDIIIPCDRSPAMAMIL